MRAFFADFRFNALRTVFFVADANFFIGFDSAISPAFAPAIPPTTAPTAAPSGPTNEPAAAPAAAPPTICRPDLALACLPALFTCVSLERSLVFATTTAISRCCYYNSVQKTWWDFLTRTPSSLLTRGPAESSKTPPARKAAESLWPDTGPWRRPTRTATRKCGIAVGSRCCP
jgi:hypothetical protein